MLARVHLPTPMRVALERVLELALVAGGLLGLFLFLELGDQVGLYVWRYRHVLLVLHRVFSLALAPKAVRTSKSLKSCAVISPAPRGGDASGQAMFTH